MKENVIINGDCLTAIPNRIAHESIDLCYIDPPFFSKGDYDQVWDNGAEILSFGDHFHGDINIYIEWMTERVRQIYNALKPTGVFVLHCDKHAVHYLKVMCDGIFGYKNFVNEIIWNYSGTGKPTKRLKQKHDNLLVYSKSKDYTFNVLTEMPTNPATIKRFNKVDGEGKKYKEWVTRGVKRIVYMKPMPLSDVWNMSVIGATSKERIGYDTQKPLSLLTRIIQIFSNEGDLVLDTFVGGGSTLDAANKLKRRWIGIDVSPTGCLISYERIFGKKDPLQIIGYPVTLKDVLAQSPLAFQQWIIAQVGGIESPTFTSDGGIDGKFPDGSPIEVKQTSAGRPVVQKFHSVVITEKKEAGVIIATSFPKTAHAAAAKIRRDHKVNIVLMTLTELLMKDFSKIQAAGIKMLPTSNPLHYFTEE